METKEIITQLAEQYKTLTTDTKSAIYFAADQLLEKTTETDITYYSLGVPMTGVSDTYNDAARNADPSDPIVKTYNLSDATMNEIVSDHLVLDEKAEKCFDLVAIVPMKESVDETYSALMSVARLDATLIVLLDYSDTADEKIKNFLYQMVTVGSPVLNIVTK